MTLQSKIEDLLGHHMLIETFTTERRADDCVRVAGLVLHRSLLPVDTEYLVLS